MTAELPAAAPDPSWFFSSLAQSSAAVVGFIGAFLIFRIQDYMNAWARDVLDLEALQRRWGAAEADCRYQDARWDEVLANRVKGTLHPNRLDYIDPSRERERDAAWIELRPLLDRRSTVEVPRELRQVALLIGALFVVGTLLPLLFLGAPTNGAQTLWLVAVATMVALTGMAMLRRAHRAFHVFKNLPLAGMVDWKYEDQQLWEQGIEEREKERRDELRRIDQEAEERIEQEREDERREDREREENEQREAERRAEAEEEARELEAEEDEEAEEDPSRP